MSFPGYISIISRDKSNTSRGGTCVLVRNQLTADLSDVDLSIPDQVWFKLKCVPEVLFGFVYIPPSDSPYFNETSLSSIQEKLETSEANNGAVIIGDLNARFGNMLQQLPNHLDLNTLSYPFIPDPTRTANNNAKMIFSICVEENVAVVNNAVIENQVYTSQLTYRQGNVWTSELDYVLVSSNMLKSIKSYNVHQDMSLPSDHAPLFINIEPQHVNLNNLLERANMLGDHCVGQGSSGKSMYKRPIKFNTVDKHMFLDKLSQCEMPEDYQDHESAIQQVSNTWYLCADASKSAFASPEQPRDPLLSRWENLIKNKDDKEVWAAINWRGELTVNQSYNMVTSPTDNQFKEFFESMLNDDSTQLRDEDYQSGIYIPILDDPISTTEVSKNLQNLDSDKACGTDGVSPGVLKMLPAAWVLMVTSLLNNIFLNASYPSAWVTAKMFMIYKKGCRLLPSNYRGISIINSFAKLYDMILCRRLQQWFQPYREQAGAQAGRGCLEHIMTLRLLIDFAKKKKIKLYVIFVDFAQAYDKVP